MPFTLHSKQCPPRGAFTLKALSAAVISAMLFSNAHAAALGKLTVLSSLGQPLRAEIELTSVSRDEIDGLTAKLASVEAFRQANIDYNSALGSLRFAVEQRGERRFIGVTSNQPLNEPFVDMLLELAGPSGRLVREYTFLLDPADLRTAQPAQVAPAAAPGIIPSSPATRQAPTSQAAPMARQSSAERPAQATVAPRQARPASPPAAVSSQARSETAEGEYQVRSGDSLARIANQVRGGGISLDQMLVALYQANPDAFIDNNMNRLKAGKILNVPGSETARGMSNADAHAIVVAQAADFSDYRGRLAGRVADTAPQRSLEARRSAGGSITAKVEEKATPAGDAKDKLKLSNSTAATGTEKAVNTMTAEDRIAKEKAIAEANARIKELEKNVGDLQKVLEVKNKSLADQQKQTDDAVKPEQRADAKKDAPVVAAAPAPAQAPEVKPAVPAASASVTPVTPPVVKAKPVAVPPAEPSLFDELTANPMVLPGLGALLVALGALGIYSARRKKQSKQFEDSIITDSSLKANSLFGSTGGQSVDTNNSVFNSSFSPSASQLDTNEVDPVAEADVYIAYGRDAQAEEILKEALRTQPNRHAVRVKLLEIYSNRKDLRAFEVLATELYGLTKGEGEEWAQAAAMGIAIDPNNPLYAGGKSASGASAVMMAPTEPLHEDGFATLLATTQANTSLDTASPLETDTSYFSNTTLTTETQLDFSSQTTAAPTPAAPAAADLDFDLDGLGFQDNEAPTSKPSGEAAAEPAPDLGSIDFNFLEQSPSTASAATVEQLPESQVVAPEQEPDLAFAMDDLPAATDNHEPVNEAETDAAEPVHSEAEISEQQPEPVTEAKSETTDPLEFDLSSISLELDPSLKQADASHKASEPEAAFQPPVDHFELPPLDGETTFGDAEMATKLDLAIAYQEIGDKEGARELLDEVLKGGTPEQSEKAKSLLVELA